MIKDVSPLLVLQARAEARAILFAAGELDFPNPCTTTDVQAAQAGRAGAAIPRQELEQAVVPLLQYAIDSGITDEIGAERAFAIVKAAFAGVAEL